MFDTDPYGCPTAKGLCQAIREVLDAEVIWSELRRTTRRALSRSSVTPTEHEPNSQSDESSRLKRSLVQLREIETRIREIFHILEAETSTATLMVPEKLEIRSDPPTDAKTDQLLAFSEYLGGVFGRSPLRQSGDSQAKPLTSVLDRSKYLVLCEGSIISSSLKLMRLKLQSASTSSRRVRYTYLLFAYGLQKGFISECTVREILSPDGQPSDKTVRLTTDNIHTRLGRVNRWSELFRKPARPVARSQVCVRLVVDEADADGAYSSDAHVTFRARSTTKQAVTTARIEKGHTLEQNACSALNQAFAAGEFTLDWGPGGLPGPIPLTTPDVVRFLRIVTPLLYADGVEVQLPDWLSRQGRGRVRTRVRLRESSGPGTGLLRLDHVVEFDWQLAVGDNPLTEEELRTLASLAAHQFNEAVIEFRGQWVTVTPEQARRAADILEGGGTDQKPLSQFLQLLTVPAAGDTHPPVVEGAAAWRAALQRLLEQRPWENFPSRPDGFTAELRPYQQDGAGWLFAMAVAGLGACLADDMGLGKTLQTLAFLTRRRSQWASPTPTVVVCPTSVLGNWRAEVRRHAPVLTAYVHHGPDRVREPDPFARRTRGYDLVLTTYPLLVRDLPLFQRTTWAGWVLDEAQAIKNAGSEQAKAAHSLAGGFRLALTGTPVENGIADVWSLMQFLNPGALGTLADFKRTYLSRPGAGQGPLDGLRRRLAPFILRRSKSDPTISPDLPAKTESVVYCPLSHAQAALYQATVDDHLGRIALAGGGGRTTAVLALLTRLKQVCDHPALLPGGAGGDVGTASGKLHRLTELLDGVAGSSEKALVFTQYTTMGELICDHLGRQHGRRPPLFHGGLSERERTDLVSGFQSSADTRVLVLSLKAGGTGLNLTAANHVVHYDRWWNPAVENQASDRAHRLGQSRPVFVHKFVCPGTVEERIDQLIAEKRTLADHLLSSDEGVAKVIAGYDAEQLGRFFRLNADAIVNEEG